MQFRVGVMIFATLLITGILVAMFGRLPSLFHGKYKVHVVFEEAPGVTVYTPVRKSGIRIGQVTKVEFVRGKFVDGEFQRTTKAKITCKSVWRSTRTGGCGTTKSAASAPRCWAIPRCNSCVRPTPISPIR